MSILEIVGLAVLVTIGEGLIYGATQLLASDEADSMVGVLAINSCIIVGLLALIFNLMNK